MIRAKKDKVFVVDAKSINALLRVETKLIWDYLISKFKEVSEVSFARPAPMCCAPSAESEL